ncbi:DUF1376 domain-containing protein [Lichenibacterium minor]|uniref:DUF1376 domain-containing protein n=1 Tax=Lichenibacterium minor TaxID=2316528 RepID=UPI001A92BBE8|nr:DUF1376 domain-containing protein [Lichenibacterium minor]
MTAPDLSNLPDPLVSAEVDLRDFAYLPLDAVRLRDSDLAALSSGDGFRAAVLLWCTSWHQSPAASLPDDDRLLARYAGYGRDVDAWKAVRNEALRGYQLCSDGRLYHPLLAEKANEAWVSKQARRARTAAATATRSKGASSPRNDDDRRPDGPAAEGDHDVDRHDPRDDDRHDEQHDRRNVHQGKGREGKGNRGSSLRSERAGAGAAEPEPFDRWWEACPHKVGKDDARKAFDRIIRDERATVDELIAGIDAYRRTKPPDRQWCNPATWLNQGRWTDQPADALPLMGGGARTSPANGAAPHRPTSGPASALIGIAAVVNAHREAS